MKYLGLFFSMLLFSFGTVMAQDVVITLRLAANPNLSDLESSITMTCSRGGQECAAPSSPSNFIVDINPSEKVVWRAISDDPNISVEIKQMRVKPGSNRGKSKLFKKDKYTATEGSANLSAKTKLNARPDVDLIDSYDLLIKLKNPNHTQWIDPKLRMKSGR